MLRVILISISVLVFGCLIGYGILNEELPQGEAGPKAEELADKINAALNKTGWDSLESISWTFREKHTFIWNKRESNVLVSWEENDILLNTRDGSGEIKSRADEESKTDEELVKKAWSYFYNDSFWLIAPFKLRDPGTSRELVEYEGKDALLVKYSSGGDTPGDAYLWILDDNFRPVSWKMWVKIIPIGGLEFSWENWKDINGAQISTFHKGPIDLNLNILDYN